MTTRTAKLVSLLALAGGVMLITELAPAKIPMGKIAGTYVGTGVGELGGQELAFHSLVHLNRDGTVCRSDTSDFGLFLPPPLTGFDSASYGTWSKTGQHEITIRDLELTFDNSGLPSGANRFTLVVIFDDVTLQTGSGYFWMEKFGPGTGPEEWLGEDIEPILSGEITVNRFN